ncbi:MAG: signal peptide peptidase SppA [Treponemataceae bacterium]
MMSNYNEDNDKLQQEALSSAQGENDKSKQESYIPPKNAHEYQGFENARSHQRYSSTNQAYKNQKKKVNSGLGVLIAIVAVATITALIGMFTEKTTLNPFSFLMQNPLQGIPFIGGSSQNTSVPKVTPITKDYVAVIKIEGVIENKNKTYDHKWLLSTIKGLIDDKRNKGILLIIESPGGGVYQSDEVYNALMQYKDETKERKIWAYITTLGASGGYYIACAADTIIANRNALIGSIGVISGASIDLSELMEKHGIKMTTFTSGKNKNMLNLNSPITEEQYEIMQSIADEAYEQFTDIVAQSRRLQLSDVKELADGRIYTANQSKKYHLIDDILYYDQMVEKMKIELELKSDIDMREFVNRPSTNFYDFLIGQESLFKAKTNNLPSIITDQLQKHPPYPAYFYFNN